MEELVGTLGCTCITLVRLDSRPGLVVILSLPVRTYKGVAIITTLQPRQKTGRALLSGDPSDHARVVICDGSVAKRIICCVDSVANAISRSKMIPTSQSRTTGPDCC